MAAKAGHKVALQQLLGVDQAPVGSEVLVQRFGKAFSAVANIQHHQGQAAALSQLNSGPFPDKCLQVAQPDTVDYLCSLIDERVGMSTSSDTASLRQRILDAALQDTVGSMVLEHIEHSENDTPEQQQQQQPDPSGSSVEQGQGGTPAEADGSGTQAQGE
jgi:hypothetical protein